MANRNVVVGGVWAKDAPDVPPVPSPLVTYANSTMSEAMINQAWPYALIVASNNSNEMLRRVTILLIEMEQQGILSYSVLTDYGIGALVQGSDTNTYKALAINGPGSAVVDPVGSPLTWQDAGAGGVTSVNATGLATVVGGGPITGTGVIDVPIADKGEAEGGANTTKAMTSLRTRQAILTAPIPTETIRGVVEKSSSDENIGGTAPDVYADVVGVVEMIREHGGGGDLLASANLSDLDNVSLSFSNIKQDATEDNTGVVQQSTDNENTDGTAASKFPTVLGVKNMIATHGGGGDLLASENLADVGDPVQAFTNIKQDAETGIKGVVEKSTTFENQGGTATDVYPDVFGVKEMIDEHGGEAGAGDMLSSMNLTDVLSIPDSFANIKQPATTVATGVVEKSTVAENTTGTLDNVYPDVPGVKLMIDTHGGGLIDVQYFTSSGIWTKPTDTTKIEVTCTAGGGEGGEWNAGTDSGVSGGTSSFGSHCSADGGRGGEAYDVGGRGGSGGFSNTGDFTIRGGDGENGLQGAMGGGSFFSGPKNTSGYVGGGGGGQKHATDYSLNGGGGGGGGTAMVFVSSGIGPTEDVIVGTGGESGSSGGGGGTGVVIVRSYK